MAIVHHHPGQVLIEGTHAHGLDRGRDGGVPVAIQKRETDAPGRGGLHKDDGQAVLSITGGVVRIGQSRTTIHGIH